MRHRRRHKSLHRSEGRNKDLLRDLTQSVLLYGRIETTFERAKEARRQVDRLITLGKRGNLQARRKALAILGKEEPLRILFKDLAPLFKNRQGGYTRVVRAWTRPGDGAQLAILELTEQRSLPKKETKPKEKKTTELKPSPETKVPKEALTPDRPKAEKPKKEKPKAEKPKMEQPKEEKPSGFLSSLRRFLKPKDRSPS